MMTSNQETEDDMAKLVNLDEASVLQNLKKRYQSDVIYVSLFL